MVRASLLLSLFVGYASLVDKLGGTPPLHVNRASAQRCSATTPLLEVPTQCTVTCADEQYAVCGAVDGHATCGCAPARGEEVDPDLKPARLRYSLGGRSIASTD